MKKTMWISGEFCRKPDLILQFYGFCETLSELLHLDVDIMMTKVFQMINIAPIVSDKDNIESIEKAFRLLWAKSNPYKQLLSHMIDTGCCAKAFLKSSSSVSLLDFLCSQWRCSKKEAISFSGYLAAMHDIGKATPQFQREDDALFSKLKSQGLSELFSEKYIGNTRHEHDSAKIAKRIWKTRKIDAQLSTPYACILSLHHQRLESNNQRQSIPGVWLEIQDKLEAEVRSTFEPPAIFPCPEQMDPVCILLTGLIILCDWVASSGPFDRISMVDENYQAASMEIAENTLQKYGLIGNRVNITVGMFSSIWPQIQTPRDIQRKCEQIISYVYLEHAVIEQEDSSIVAIQKDGHIPIPVSSVTCLMLGPGTKVTHAAMKAAAEHGCMIVWCGENGMHFYASGMGETRSAANLLRQVALCSNPDTRLEIEKRMYIRRFGNISNPDYTLQQLRGMEGIRVREAYKLASRSTGISWSARSYKKDDWNAQDPVNQALSHANALLYSVCQAAIISLGYSPGLGFIHTGKQLSFVYDIADLYKAEVTIPAAFQSARYPGTDLSATVRVNCRKYFQQIRLLKRIPEDIEWIFDLPGSEQRESLSVGNLWSPEGEIPGGVNHHGDEELW